MTRPGALLSALALLALAGCGNLETLERGGASAVDPGQQSLPGGLPMTFDRLGDARVADRRVELPRGRELQRFGLTVVDLGPMHRFVPAHIGDERRVVVSSLELPSPFAVAGLRPFDVITAVDGQPVSTTDDVISRLSAKEEGEVARLSVVRPDGETAEVTAEASERVLRQGGFWIPLLAERQSTGGGHALGLGPIDSLFFYRSALIHWPVPAEEAASAGGAPPSPFPPVDAELNRQSRSRYARRFEWGTLLNLFHYQSEVDLQTGEERSRFRLFWLLSFGDDLDAREGA